jgi:hypothetical protein
MTTSIEAIVDDSSLTVPQKSERVTALLVAQPDLGVAMAVGCLLVTDDERVAAFAADYLALVPDAHADKTRAAARLRTAGPLVLAASDLVPWLPDDLLGGFVADYLAEPDPKSPLFSVIYEIACFRPDLLRPHRERLDHPWLRQGMLSGAPDALVDELLARWQKEGNPELLDDIARIRTDRAAKVLLSLRHVVEDRLRWEALVDMAGRLPDGNTPSSYFPAFLGLVVDSGESPHVMGGPFPRAAPEPARGEHRCQ